MDRDVSTIRTLPNRIYGAWPCPFSLVASGRQSETCASIFMNATWTWMDSDWKTGLGTRTGLLGSKMGIATRSKEATGGLLGLTTRNKNAD